MNYLYISLLLLASATASVAQTITTVAGTGTAGFNNEDEQLKTQNRGLKARLD